MFFFVFAEIFSKKKDKKTKKKEKKAKKNFKRRKEIIRKTKEKFHRIIYLKKILIFALRKNETIYIIEVTAKGRRI